MSLAKNRAEFAIYPAPQVSTAVVEPYNSILTTYTTLEHSDNCAFGCYEAIYDTSLVGNPRLKCPYTNLQQTHLGQIYVVHHCIPAIIDGSANVAPDRIPDQLGPYHKILPTQPLMHQSSASQKAYHEQLSALLNSCFRAGQPDGEVRSASGKFMACCMLYRGDVVPKMSTQLSPHYQDQANHPVR